METFDNHYTTCLSRAGYFSAKIGIYSMAATAILVSIGVVMVLSGEQRFELKSLVIVALLVLLAIWFIRMEKQRWRRVADIVTLTSDTLEVITLSGVKRTMPYHSITSFVDERLDQLSPGLVIKSSLCGGGISFPAEMENFKDFTTELHRRIKAKENRVTD